MKQQDTHLLNVLVHSLSREAEELDYKAQRTRDIYLGLDSSDILGIDVSINFFGGRSETIKYRRPEGKVSVDFETDMFDSLNSYLQAYIHYHKILAHRKREQIPSTVNGFIVDHLKSLSEDELKDVLEKIIAYRTGGG